MATIYEEISAPIIAEKWTENNEQRKPFLGEAFFPQRKQLGIDLSYFKGNAPKVRPLDLSSFDAKVIPISREVIYQIYSLRGNLADNLEMQANFLDLNKSCVENNEIMTEDKKRKILAKQEKLSKKLQTLANKIRVKSSKSIMDSKRELNKDNRMLTIDNIKDEISNSPLELI